jgi:hypothetical protein
MTTDTALPNPWLALPKQPPYIFPGDVNVLKQCGNKIDGLRFDVLPDPFVGNLETAEVILLALNPGFEQADLDVCMSSELYVKQTLANLQSKADTPFFFFHKGLEFSGGNWWWNRKLRPLTNAGVTRKQLSERIMCIEYLPYHSVHYKHLNRYLPSQQYTFHLVRQAIREGKAIIVMRSERIWLEAVPELATYPYMKIKNPQNPAISVANLGQDNFDLLCSRLKA